VNAAHPIVRMRAGNAAMLGRTVVVVAIFAVVGPPAGAVVIWIVFAIIDADVWRAILTLSPLELGQLFLGTVLLAYKLGAALAALVGPVVMLLQRVKGQPSLQTPVVATLVADAVGTLFFVGFGAGRFGMAGYLFSFVPPSLVAAIICWLIARKMELI